MVSGSEFCPIGALKKVKFDFKSPFLNKIKEYRKNHINIGKMIGFIFNRVLLAANDIKNRIPLYK